MIDEIINAAISPIVPALEPNRYRGEALEYVTWNYTTIPVIFADSTPDAARYLIQVHWFLPHEVNPNAKKLSICRALHNAGLTYPSITNATDKDGQHYVFECEFADGGV